MAFAFDTLGYAKRLRDSGVANLQAEAHAEAAREFIMTELVTKADLMGMKSDVLGVKSDLLLVKSDLLLVKSELQAAIETQTLRLTVRLGGIVAVGIGVLAAGMGILALMLRLR